MNKVVCLVSPYPLIRTPIGQLLAGRDDIARVIDAPNGVEMARELDRYGHEVGDHVRIAAEIIHWPTEMEFDWLYDTVRRIDAVRRVSARSRIVLIGSAYDKPEYHEMEGLVAADFTRFMGEVNAVSLNRLMDLVLHQRGGRP